jgi:hypothetical protein
MIKNIYTPLGGKVQIHELPEHLVGKVEDGVMLCLSMQDPDDLRFVEIALSRENVIELHDACRALMQGGDY